MRIILLAIFSVYAISMLLLIIGWLSAIAKKENAQKKKEKRTFSVIIPFRNEIENLQALVDSLSVIDYPIQAVEFIFVNDHSTDSGCMLLEKMLLRFRFSSQLVNLLLGETGKKKAIEKAISMSKNSFIITTDADCVVKPNWLERINEFQDKEAQFIIGPVINKKSVGFLANLQQIEALMLAGITVGSASLKKPLLCSGANLSYSKLLFEELTPYCDNIEIMSGDDMFFLEKVIRHNVNIEVDKENVVETKGAKTFNEMLSRSVRWASKSRKLNLFWTSIFSAIVLITNYSMLFIFVMFFFTDNSIVFFIKLCGIKTFFDVIFLILLANRYSRYEVLLYFPVMVVFYPFYLFIVSFASVLTSSKWKER